MSRLSKLYGDEIPLFIKRFHQPDLGLISDVAARMFPGRTIEKIKDHEIRELLIAEAWDICSKFSTEKAGALLDWVKRWGDKLKANSDTLAMDVGHFLFIRSMYAEAVPYSDDELEDSGWAIPPDETVYDTFGEYPLEGWTFTGDTFSNIVYKLPPVVDKLIPDTSKRWQFPSTLKATMTWREVFKDIDGRIALGKERRYEIRLLYNILRMRESVLENVLYQQMMFGEVKKWTAFSDDTKAKTLGPSQTEREDFIRIMGSHDLRRHYIYNNIMTVGDRWAEHFEELQRRCDFYQTDNPYTTPEGLKEAMNKWIRKGGFRNTKDPLSS